MRYRWALVVAKVLFYLIIKQMGGVKIAKENKSKSEKRKKKKKSGNSRVNDRSKLKIAYRKVPERGSLACRLSRA